MPDSQRYLNISDNYIIFLCGAHIKGQGLQEISFRVSFSGKSKKKLNIIIITDPSLYVCFNILTFGLKRSLF